MSEPRKIWCPHVTVATVVADDDRFLMVEEDIRGERRFNQPAGHLEPDETLAAAAVRETREETGWDVALDHFIGTWQWWSPVHNEYIVRFAFAGHTLTPHPEQALDTGICRALWLRRDEIITRGQQLRSPLVLASIDAWLAGQRLPLSVLHDLLPQTVTTP
ncbi:MAG TPA: NUDIX hydrolase [Rhodanobacteraceae bacterium]